MKKINNKILALGLVVLVGIFVVSRLVRAPKLEGNVRRELVKLDITKVTEVRIAAADSSVSLLKENGQWNVQNGQNKIEADSGAVARMLQQIQALQALRMASRKKEKWADYKVDSSATHVSVFYGSDKEADFYVGKIDVTQQPNNPQGFSAFTYIRLDDEDEVYVVEGFLGSALPPGPGAWKKRSVN